MGQEDFDRIQPASLDLGVSAGGTSATGDPRGQKRVIFLVLALLALTAAAVVFLLPRMIPETSAPEDPTAPISPAPKRAKAQNSI